MNVNCDITTKIRYFFYEIYSNLKVNELIVLKSVIRLVLTGKNADNKLKCIYLKMV